MTTSFRGQEVTRNLVQFRSCHKFRAKTRMVLDVAAGNSAGDPSADAVGSAPSAATKLEDDNKVYDILREQALREDAARLERETNQELEAATVEVFRKLNGLERQRQKYLAQQAESETSAVPSSSKEDLTTLKVSVNLVPVSVVLRDAKGNAMGSLRKEDFHLFDNGKPQAITSFSVERAETVAPADSTYDKYPTNPGAKLAAAAAMEPCSGLRFLMTFTLLAISLRREGGGAPHRRVAPIRSCGSVHYVWNIGTEFTADREKLQQALKGCGTRLFVARCARP